jgi:tetratricopeptide (TPR) repeat protein
LGRCGEAYRLLGDLPQAVPLLEEAVALARRQADPRRRAANLIRLATAYQYRNDHAAARPLFDDALALTRAHPAEAGTYEDFALQHLGKCLVEMGHLAEARACFDQALVLRQAKGDPGLLASTQEALTALAARSGPPEPPPA